MAELIRIAERACTRVGHRLCATALALCGASALALAHPGNARSAGPDLVVSGNSGAFVRVDGRSTYPQPHPPSSLTVIDAAATPPRVVNTVPGITISIKGPPQAVAITPDGRTAFVGAATRVDYAQQQEDNLNSLQIVDLSHTPGRLGAVIDVGAQVNGLAINPAGTLLLATALNGMVYAYTIEGQALRLVSSAHISRGWLGGVAITADGRTAIVSRRTEGGAVVLDLAGPHIGAVGELVATGVGPYTVDVTSDGRWAVIGNSGLAGLPAGTAAGGVDSFTLVDTSVRPFRAITHQAIPSTPESVAISPDGRWIVAQSLNGSNLPATAAGWAAHGRVSLFAVSATGTLTPAGELPDGVAAQGIAFGRDNRTILVQNNVERNLAVYRIVGGRLTDTGERIPLAAGPVSLRTQPR